MDRSCEAESREHAGLPPGYTVIFSGPAGVVLAEGVHALASENGSVLGVYISPIHAPARDRQDD